MSDKKVLGIITIKVFEGNAIGIESSFENQNTVRNILKTAEEVVIEDCLEKASKPKSNILSLGKAN